MDLETILSKAINRQRIIGLKQYGLGGYKKSKYTFANDATVEVTEGNVTRTRPWGFKERVATVEKHQVVLRWHDEIMIFHMPLSDVALEIINDHIK